MFFPRGAVLGFVLLLLGCTPSAAAVGKQVELYAARVPVVSQQQDERQEAFRQAFLQVLVKVTGERTLPQHPTLIEALSRPERYVAEFGYATELGATPDEGGAPPRQLLLWTQFDAAAVDALLRDANIPAWTRTRPSVLLWFAVEEANGPVVLGADSGHRLTALLEETAAQRGLHLILPLRDLEDRARLSESKLWGGFEEDILAASKRYQSDAVLVGRAYPLLADQWETRWSLLLGGSARDWSARGPALEPLVADGVHQAAGYIAERFRTRYSSTAAESMELVVGGVNSLADYASLIGYLETLPIVQAVQVEKLQGDRIWLLVKARGGAATLRDALALNRRLVAAGVAPGLEFELQP